MLFKHFMGISVSCSQKGVNHLSLQPINHDPVGMSSDVELLKAEPQGATCGGL